MYIKIIGASGFLGTALTIYLLENKYHVDCDDINKPEKVAKGFRYSLCDVIKDDIEVASGTDVVIYLSQSSFYRNDLNNVDNLFGVNTYGAVKASVSSIKKKVKLFIYASTGNVYVPSYYPLNEKHPVRRDNTYALSKIAAEEALKLFSSNMDVICLRFFGIFGPGQKSMLPIKILNSIINEDKIFLQPSQINKYDFDGIKISFTYINDVVKIIEKLIKLSAEGVDLPPVLNIAYPFPISIRYFSETLGAILQKRPLFIKSNKTRDFDLIADISLLNSIIDDLKFTQFEEAMKETYSEHKV